MDASSTYSEEILLEALFTPLHQITEYIYLGNQTAAGYVPPHENAETIAKESREALQKLKDLGIKHIVCCADNLKVFPDDLDYFLMDLKDKPLFPISEYFEKAYEYIDDCVTKKEKVLIHCNAGVTRSATITISYLMRNLKISFEEAHKMVRAKRPCIDIKVFEEDLKQLEASLKKSII